MHGYEIVQTTNINNYGSENYSNRLSPGSRV